MRQNEEYIKSQQLKHIEDPMWRWIPIYPISLVPTGLSEKSLSIPTHEILISVMFIQLSDGPYAINALPLPHLSFFELSNWWTQYLTKKI